MYIANSPQAGPPLSLTSSLLLSINQSINRGFI